MGLGDKDISFDIFLAAVSKIKSKGGAYQGTRDDNKIVLHGHTNENTTHTINADEKESFTIHVNQALADDKDCRHLLPIDPKSMGLFPNCRGCTLLIIRWNFLGQAD
jgi:plastin-1